jgi:chorismate mutase
VNDLAADPIGTGRQSIDEIDQQIIDLIRQRMLVSAGIQQARIASGGGRVELAREMQVIGRYREALGKPGTTVAMSLLDLCRGRP